jgi:hypothetical protein
MTAIHRHWTFTGRESARLADFYGVIAVLHLVGWRLFLSYSHSFGAA